jgi:gamma-glutamyltranspeptidase/glutathione hydrolase
MKRVLALLLTAALAAPAAAQKPPQAANGRAGAVAAEEEIAARVGIWILRRGGNAADAAVATAFALAVTWPEAGNIGGGGFWISRDAAGRVLVVDFREVAPRAARRDMFQRIGRDGKPRSSTTGPLASGVPGSVAGLSLAHRRLGRLSWKQVVDPAVRLARDGFHVTKNVSDSIAAYSEKLARDREASRIFLPDGRAPEPGSLFKQPDLARTLAAIRDRGADGFYRGEIAQKIESREREAGGIVTRGDLGRYRAQIRRPIRFAIEDATVWTTPAPSSGPSLAQMSLMATAAGAGRFRARDAEAAHWTAEIERRAFLDRNRYLGDPAFGGVRQQMLVDAARAARLVAAIDPNRATPTASLVATAQKTVAAGPGSTTHLSVADASGTVVALTTTLNDSFGSGRVSPGLGFLWNDEMDDFTARPGQPNQYGLVQGEVNAVAPGKRMLSSMCPTILRRSDGSVFAFGAPGGATILTTNFQVLLGLAVRRETLLAAIAAPRFHQQDFPDAVEVERDRFDAAWTASLEAKGHAIKISDRSPIRGAIGRVHAVAVHPDGRLEAAADPRRSGAAYVAAP